MFEWKILTDCWWYSGDNFVLFSFKLFEMSSFATEDNHINFVTLIQIQIAKFIFGIHLERL
jgi:hypothetical protein